MKSDEKYAIGLDFGTNSARCLVVRITDGFEAGTGVAQYAHGDKGVILDDRDPDFSRQHPDDYAASLIQAVRVALEMAHGCEGFSSASIIGIGTDTTGSTPLPLDEKGDPLTRQERFARNPNAMAWLWKDHTAHEEAAAITRIAAEHPANYMRKYGGVYSPEWFFAKVWHCLNEDPEVFDAAHTWAEISDWIPALLSGTQSPARMKRNQSAAGHKSMFHEDWGGLPAEDFFERLSPRLKELRARLFNETATVNQTAGCLTQEWAEQLGLPVGIPVAAGALDGHLGAVGCGIQPGDVVNIFGTSSVLMTVRERGERIPDIPGICGVVNGGILPGHHGVEAGQAATGDLFNWWVDRIQAGGAIEGGHQALTELAAHLKPGESGLMALDWNNGNRCLLADPRLSGLLIGQTLQTSPAEIYRALIEATAFGVKTILDRFAEYGLRSQAIITAGGIALKNPLVMQIYADITGLPQKIARSTQTCALGAAMCGAVAAGPSHGGHASLPDAQRAMSGCLEKVYRPDPTRQEVYEELGRIYCQLQDAFGSVAGAGSLHSIMKDLLRIRDDQRRP